MPLVWLLVAIVMMFLGGMLMSMNPAPMSFNIGIFGLRWTVTASILEIIGLSVVGGAVAMAVPYLRQVWVSGRERRGMEHETKVLRDENLVLRRDAENARTETRLLEARVAEVEERYAQLEAEARPLLTMKQAGANGRAEADDLAAPRSVTPAASRWRRR